MSNSTARDEWEFSLRAKVLGLIVGATVVYLIYDVVQKLFLCPIAKVPGPKLAALTRAYEAYFDLVENGRFPWQIDALHEKYGSYGPLLTILWKLLNRGIKVPLYALAPTKSISTTLYTQKCI